MAYSLRLPAALDAAARNHASNMGISLNALVCVALDAYLRGASRAAEGAINPGQAGIEPDGAVWKTDTSTTGFQSSKADRREYTRQQRLARKAQR